MSTASRMRQDNELGLDETCNACQSNNENWCNRVINVAGFLADSFIIVLNVT